MTKHHVPFWLTAGYIKNSDIMLSKTPTSLVNTPLIVTFIFPTQIRNKKCYTVIKEGMILCQWLTCGTIVKIRRLNTLENKKVTPTKLIKNGCIMETGPTY